MRRALILDVVLTLLMLGLSLMADEQLWRVIWCVGALVAVLDALLASVCSISKIGAKHHRQHHRIVTSGFAQGF